MFIDQTKSIYKVKHEEITSLKTNIDGEDLSMIRNVSWQQNAAIKMNMQLGIFQYSKQGLDRVVYYPPICSICSCTIMRSILGMPGIIVGGHNEENLSHAYDSFHR